MTSKGIHEILMYSFWHIKREKNVFGNADNDLSMFLHVKYSYTVVDVSKKLKEAI